MYIKLFGLLIFITLCSLRANAQEFTENEIVGTWNVVNVHLVSNNPFPANHKAELEMLKKSFSKAVFYFKFDKNFSFKIDIADMQIKKAYWNYNKLTNSFLVQDWKDKNSKDLLLMEISAKKVGDKMIFLLSESFLELEVRKE